jgi:MFS family permease
VGTRSAVTEPDGEHAAVQRRTVRVLVASQILGGVGVGAGFAVISLLAFDLTGTASLSGIPPTVMALGAAAAALAIARLAVRSGRRSGLVTGYLVGAGGAALAVVAAVAGSFLLHVVSSLGFGFATAANLHVMRGVGMTSAQIRRAAAFGPGVAAATGAVAGAVASVVAAQCFPIGAASVVEPKPGIDIDVAVLSAGLIAVPVIVAAGAVVAAVLAEQKKRAGITSRRSTVAAAASVAGLPVPVVTGARLALETGPGQRAVAVRPVLFGVTAGVAVVLGALTFAAAVEDTSTNPRRLGILHGAEAYVGFSGFSFNDASVEAVFTALAETPGVSGVQDVIGNIAQSGGEQILVVADVAVGAPGEYILAEGRPPTGSAETVVGLRAADVLNVAVGDTVTVSGADRDVELAVVGIGVLDSLDTSVIATTRLAYDALFGEQFMFRMGEVQFEPGVDFPTILPSLRHSVADVPGATPDDVGIIPPEYDVPGLRFLRPLPIWLAGFVAALTLGAVGHAVATTVQRRRADIAVLRSLGMTPAQTWGVVTTSATVLATAGLAVGIPLGVALGRNAWRYVADALYVHYVPPVAWLALILVVPLALLAANLLAMWPARRAASMRVGHVLRAE